MRILAIWLRNSHVRKVNKSRWIHICEKGSYVIDNNSITGD